MTVRPGIMPFLLLAVAGCADTPVRDIRVSTGLRANPVRSVYVFEPGFAGKVKRAWPDDLPEMLPASRAESASRIMSALKEAIGASLTVDSSYSPDEKARGWARDIAEELAKGRVPLNVKPLDLPVESALIVGVVAYGRQNVQISLQLLWFKRKGLGKPKWNHTCDLVGLLVNPREGSVLLDARYETSFSTPEGDPQLVEKACRESSRAIAAAFPGPGPGR
jgi:hypothetical protein